MMTIHFPRKLRIVIFISLLSTPSLYAADNTANKSLDHCQTPEKLSPIEELATDVATLEDLAPQENGNKFPQSELFSAVKAAIEQLPSGGSVSMSSVSTEKNTVKDLIEGRQNIFQEIARQIEQAKSEVLFSTYLWEGNSEAAKTLLEGIKQLQENIKKNPSAYHLPVRVKIISDKLTGISKRIFSFLSGAISRTPRSNDNQLLGLNLDPALVEFEFLEFRHNALGSNHSKYLIIDGHHVVMTSANAQDRIYNEMGITLKGEAAHSLRENFLQYLYRRAYVVFSNHTLKSTDHPPIEQNQDKGLSSNAGESDILVISRRRGNGLKSVFFRNDNNHQNLAFRTIFKNAKSNIKIFTPNLNFGDYTHTLLDALKRGVNIEIILSEKFNDSKQRKLLLQGGQNHNVIQNIRNEYNKLKTKSKHSLESRPPLGTLEIKYYRNPEGIVPPNSVQGSHMKYLSADNEITVIGSANMDTQSWYHSHEVNFLIYNPDKTRQWNEEFFKKHWDNSISP